MKSFFTVVLIFTAIFVYTVTIFAAERALPVFDDRSWKLGWSQNKDGGVFEEYILDGETVENWSELVTIQFFPGLNKKINIDIFEASQKTELTSICPSIKWESISQSDDERIWKWTISGDPGQPDQSEIARLKRTEEGFHLWHYAIKRSPIPSEKEKVWLENLKSIKMIKNGQAR